MSCQKLKKENCNFGKIDDEIKYKVENLLKKLIEELKLIFKLVELSWKEALERSI